MSESHSFTPVPGRDRRDGWTPERQRRFIAALAETRNLTAAARAAGLSRAAAYALRRRAGEDSSFARAWTTALATPRTTEPPVTIDDLLRGTRKAYFYGGRQRAEWHVMDNARILRLLRARARDLQRHAAYRSRLASSHETLSSSELRHSVGAGLSTFADPTAAPARPPRSYARPPCPTTRPSSLADRARLPHARPEPHDTQPPHSPRSAPRTGTDPRLCSPASPRPPPGS